jgi:putative phage-type endonuclease
VTPAQRSKFLAERRKGIGGSDVGAVLGLDRFRNPLDVYHEKLALGEPQAQNADMDRGVALEPLILNMVENHFERPVQRPKRMLKNPKALWMVANLDGVLGQLGEPEAVLVEAKAPRSSTFDRIKAEGPPESWVVQMQWYLRVADVQRGLFAILNADRWELLLLPVERDDALGADLEAAMKNFWFNHVLAKVPPADPMKLTVPLPNGGEAAVLDADPEMLNTLSDYEQAAGMEREAERLKKAAHERLVGLLPGFGKYLVGDARISYTEVVSMRFDRKAAERELGDLSRFEKASKYSKLTVSHPKGEE